MLDGKTIAITRSKDDATEFIALAEQNGATPIPLPTIELVSKGEKIVDEFLESIERYNPDYSVFMSSKAVKLLFDTAKQVGKLEKLQLAVANTMVMSVGPKTTTALNVINLLSPGPAPTRYTFPVMFYSIPLLFLSNLMQVHLHLSHEVPLQHFYQVI